MAAEHQAVSSFLISGWPATLYISSTRASCFAPLISCTPRSLNAAFSHGGSLGRAFILLVLDFQKESAAEQAHGGPHQNCPPRMTVARYAHEQFAVSLAARDLRIAVVAIVLKAAAFPRRVVFGENSPSRRHASAAPIREEG